MDGSSAARGRDDRHRAAIEPRGTDDFYTAGAPAAVGGAALDAAAIEAHAHAYTRAH